jgi:hypothetical protein
MTNIEMLELAAKAAGYRVISIQNGKLNVTSDNKKNFHWNPFTDDGDAFRLMCALYLEPKPSVLDGYAYCDGSYEIHDFGEIQTVAEATRLVIVRAAAEIGRKMK